MAIIAPGTTVPDFVLKTADGEDFTPADLEGKTTVLVFYPFAFSPVCTDQLQIYDEVMDDFTAKGAKVYGVSTDATYSQAAFKDKLGVSIEQLSDFEPKGAASRALGAYFEPAGMTNRALLIIGPDKTVTWSYEAGNPGELPGVGLLFDNL
ncbi:MAG: redoxin protein [Solirubrobacterales bacterium]|nr:redoxin protein [Solirubrobacterales bacterium]